MTTQERLEIYTAMYLYYYSAARKGLAYKYELHLDEGFCYWLRWELAYDMGLKSLPELSDQNPLTRYAYWFSEGAIYPRLRCIEKAIALCEETIRQEELIRHAINVTI